MRRVWPRAASMLSPVFACDAPGLLGGAPTLPVGAALDVFFLKAVSVPPNKFRPPSFMNGVVRNVPLPNVPPLGACLPACIGVLVFWRDVLKSTEALGHLAHGMRQELYHILEFIPCAVCFFGAQVWSH